MPSTVRRSPEKAQRTWSAALDSAEEEYGEGRRARLTAFTALRTSFEKVGDHWEPRHQSVSAPSTLRAELFEQAARLDIKGRSYMTEEELARAIARKQ